MSKTKLVQIASLAERSVRVVKTSSVSESLDESGLGSLLTWASSFYCLLEKLNKTCRAYFGKIWYDMVLYAIIRDRIFFCLAISI